MADSLVRVIVGKLGSGKSWYAVAKILDALMAGDVVVSNLRLNWPACEVYFGAAKVPRANYRYVSTEEIQVRPMVLLETLTEGSTLVIDEVHLWLSARAWRENQERAAEFMTFLTQARKLSIDCYLISQDERNIDAQLVRMATNIVRLVNWRHFPVMGSLFPVNLTVARICQPDGVTAIGREWVWRYGGVGKCYDTKQRFKSIELTGRKAGAVRGRRSKSMSPGAAMIAAGVACLLLDRAIDYRAAAKESERLAEVAAIELAKSEREASRAPKVALAAPADVVPVGRFDGEGEGPLSSAELAKIEAALPSVYAYNPTYFVLVGGHRIYHDGYFLGGKVLGWKRDGGTLLVRTDSPEIPLIRLFYANRPSPVLYDYERGLIRRTGHGGGGVRGQVVGGNSQLAESVQLGGQGDSGPGPVPMGSFAAPVYQAPPPFISPPMGTMQSIGDYVGERQGEAVKPHGFGTRRQRSGTR